MFLEPDKATGMILCILAGREHHFTGTYRLEDLRHYIPPKYWHLSTKLHGITP